MLAVLGAAGLGFGHAPCSRLLSPAPPPTPRRPSAASRRSNTPVIMSVGDLLTDAADGDISAALEAAALAIAGLASVGVAWSLVEREEDEDVDTLPVTDRGEVRKVTVDVDLGANGEPKGEQRLFFKPLLPRSEFVLLELRVPLGLLIEEQQLTSGGSTPAEAAALRVGAAGGGAGTIQVTGALPGYSAFNQVEKGDLLRAVTAYAAVAGDAPMWQQVASALRANLNSGPNPSPRPTINPNPGPSPDPNSNPNTNPDQVTSGTPVGDVTSKRLIFKTDGASCGSAHQTSSTAPASPIAISAATSTRHPTAPCLRPGTPTSGTPSRPTAPTSLPRATR